MLILLFYQNLYRDFVFTKRISHSSLNLLFQHNKKIVSNFFFPKKLNAYELKPLLHATLTHT